MGREVAGACLRRGFRLAPVALTGSRFGGSSIEVNPEPTVEEATDESVTVELVDAGGGPEQVRLAAVRIQEAAKAAGCGSVVCVDYTHPDAVNGNAEWYAEHGFSFVMGTTGGDREAMMRTVAESGVHAVIAPNMAKQIVALQAALEDTARSFPGAFEGYRLTVTESHQSTKADTSGTAKAVVRALNELNNEFDASDGEALERRITRIRDPPKQVEFGVPDTALKGHAFHTYTLTSDDGSVTFALQHNVVGRRVYAEGTADAVAFVAAARQAGTDQKVFSMVDVLKAGAMQ
uniref:4-hydroxy-tetrahydrodipicolinate reductase n=1 Tax=Rhizochromulina marina TaxID=1034831 RepID=A0A7S2S660_9STRA